jgi:hypothetical protein
MGRRVLAATDFFAFRKDTPNDGVMELLPLADLKDSTLFSTEPSMVKSDYAKWMLEKRKLPENARCTP